MLDNHITTRGLAVARWSLVMACAACVLWARPAAAQEHVGEREQLVGILEGLEHGLVALERLGRHEEHRMLERIADDVRRALHEQGARHRDVLTREVAARQIEVLRMALPALREAQREEAVELVERAIRAREVALEGRRDEEARRIRDRAPNRERTVELLVLAEQIYQEYGNRERAHALSRMTEELWRPRRERRSRETERERAIHEMEVMRLALPALREGGRRDAADLLERAIQGREAGVVRGGPGPGPGDLAEILHLAADLWREFGHPDRAEVVAELAEQMRARWRERRERHERQVERSPVTRRETALHRVEQLENRIAELERAIDRLHQEIREMHRRRD
ncbi:MAG: hypothetical protein ACYSXF_02970 [Planctomycetota bacterium]|jgi:hypothetical protein